MKHLFILFFLFHALVAGAGVEVTGLQCGYMENPLGITQEDVLFSWKLLSPRRGQRQTAYQVIVASAPRQLATGTGDIWDSGMVTSAFSTGIPYNGKTLSPATEYYWKVRIWDSDGVLSPWSPPATFVTGLLRREDWSGAQWTGFEDLPDSLVLVPGVHGSGDKLGNVALRRPVTPLFRRSFRADKTVRQALVFISGLGHYELSLNGKKVGDRFLAPGWTDYRKTVLYNTYDVTELLENGENVLGVITGSGFYNINRERYRKLVIAYGMPKFILKLQITYDDGSREVVVSDENWRTAPSPILYTSIYGGEDYDAGLEQEGWNAPGFDDKSWKRSVEVRIPEGRLRPERDYPVRIMQAIPVRKVTQLRKNVFIYDFGQNASGIIRLKIKGRKGQQVRIVPGELLDENGDVTQKASGSPYFFTYTLRGGGVEIWQPRFTYYGFRYARVEGAIPAGRINADGLPEILEMKLLHTGNSSPSAGSFKCLYDLFNRTFKLIDWAIRSNMASVMTDCPHREKLGWLEQVHLMGNSVKYNYQVHDLLVKMTGDMKDAQLDNGLVPDIAPEYVPFYAGFRDSPEWGSAAVIVPWYVYRWYADSAVLRSAYPMMKKYAAYLLGKSDGYILSHGLGDWYDLGPKNPGPSQLTPKGLTATAIFYYDLKILMRVAELFNKPEEATYYLALSENVRKAFNKKFFKPETGVYATGSQTSYAMPLYFNMVDEAFREKVAANLVSSIEKNDYRLTAGDIGYRYLLRALEEAGRSDVIYKMNAREDVPGYGYQLARGATALTESWPALRFVSNNHMMLGHLMEWFYSGLAGIRQAKGSTGYETVVIDPQPVGGIAWVKAFYRSVHGEIRSDWEIKEGKLTLSVTVPANTEALVYLPARDLEQVTESGRPLEKGRGIRSFENEGEKLKIRTGSGKYVFVVMDFR